MLKNSVLRFQTTFWQRPTRPRDRSPTQIESVVARGCRALPILCILAPKATLATVAIPRRTLPPTMRSTAKQTPMVNLRHSTWLATIASTRRPLTTRRKTLRSSHRHRLPSCRSHRRRWRTFSGRVSRLASIGVDLLSKNSISSCQYSMRRKMGSTWPSSAILRSWVTGPTSGSARSSGPRATTGSLRTWSSATRVTSCTNTSLWRTARSNDGKWVQIELPISMSCQIWTHAMAEKVLASCSPPTPCVCKRQNQSHQTAIR